MMGIVVTVFEETGHTVSENKSEAMLLRAQEYQAPLTPPLDFEAAGQRYYQTAQVLYLNAYPSLEIYRRVRLMWTCLKRFGPDGVVQTNDSPAKSESPHRAGGREVIETPLYEWLAWALRAEQIAKLPTAHHQVSPLVGVVGFQRRLRTDDTALSYAKGPQDATLRGHPNGHP